MRASQIISPFGVGSLMEVNGQSFIVKDTTYWKAKYFGTNKKMYQNLQNIEHEGLTSRMRGYTLKKPLYIVPIQRFPLWHFCSNCRYMERIDYTHDQIIDGPDGQEVQFPTPICKTSKCNKKPLSPMRFIQVCQNGHISDIDWHYWAHRDTQQSQSGPCDPYKAKLRFEVSSFGGGDFSSMHIICDCTKSKKRHIGNSLEQLNQIRPKCKGEHPGVRKVGECTAANGKSQVMEIHPRGASSIHYPSSLSALDISKKENPEPRFTELINFPLFLQAQGGINALQGVGMAREAILAAQQENIDHFSNHFDIPRETVIHALFNDTETNQVTAPIEGQELTQKEILESEYPVLTSSSPQNSENLKTLPKLPSNALNMKKFLKKIVQIEKLREVRVFKGFQRLDFGSGSPLISPDLNRSEVKWLPAIEVFGEGIFLEFSEDAISKWELSQPDILKRRTEKQIEAAFEQGLPEKKGFEPDPKFIMLHTFAHLLITQLTFDCGYGSSSLRERIYSGSNQAGVLIYTADADSEGSMGGLVEMGTPEKIAETIFKAVSKAQWCSSDPVCRELEVQGIGGLNGAACHGCSIVAETSCTYSNILLNRLLVAGDGRRTTRGTKEPKGFFFDVLNGEV